MLQHADVCHSMKFSLSSAVLAHNNLCHVRKRTNASVTRTAKSLSVPQFTLLHKQLMESTFIQRDQTAEQRKAESVCVLLNVAEGNLYICTIVSVSVYRQRQEFWYIKRQEWSAAWRKQDKSLFLLSVHRRSIKTKAWLMSFQSSYTCKYKFIHLLTKTKARLFGRGSVLKPKPFFSIVWIQKKLPCPNSDSEPTLPPSL